MMSTIIKFKFKDNMISPWMMGNTCGLAKWKNDEVIEVRKFDALKEYEEMEIIWSKQQ